MHAIVRQVKANLRSRKLQSALILLTLFTAAALLTVALSTLRTAQGAYDRLFERTHGAHLWISLDPARVTAEEAETILADLPDVEATTAAMHSLHTQLFTGEERMNNQELREWPDEAVTVARPLLVTGRAPQEGETEAIVLDRNVAAEHGVEVGDTVSLPVSDGQQSLTVTGLSVNAEWCPYPNCQPARDYLAPGAMADLGLLSPPEPGREWASMKRLAIGLRLRDPADLERVRQAAVEALPAESVLWSSDWERTRSASNSLAQIQATFLTAFSVVAGLAAGFFIANAVGGAVRAQTRQIGLLKAVGFTGRQLALVYLVESLGLALAASLAGLTVGGLTASAILRSVVAQFGESLARPPLWIALVVPLSTLLITSVFTLWPVRRAVRLDVVEAIRFGAEQPRRRMARLPRIRPTLALGVSNVLSRPLRSTLTTLGLGMAVFTLAFTLILNTSVQLFVSNPAQMGMGVDGDLTLNHSRNVPAAEVRRLIAEQPNVNAHYTEIWGEFQFPGEEATLMARFREGDLEAFMVPLLEGRMFERPDEAIIGHGLARERNLHLGDTLTILLEDEPVTLRVVGIYREPSNVRLMLPAETLRRVSPDVEFFRYVLKLQAGADAQATATALRSASGDLLEVEVVDEADLPDAITSLPWVMAALSLVLGGIAVAGVFNSVWMGVQEQQREFGLLKAVGMRPGQVTLSVLAGAVGMALVAFATGLPLGVVGTRLLLDTLARWSGFGPLNPPVDVIGLALLLPGIVLVAVVGAFLPAHRAGRVSVVEMLRYE